MAQEITDRIRQIMEEYGYSSSVFADEIGVQRPAISHILSGRNRPSLDVVMKILKAFDEINPQWLLTGEGKMKQLNLFGQEEAKEQPETAENKQVTNNSASESRKSEQAEPSPAIGESQSPSEPSVPTTGSVETPAPNKYVRPQPEVPYNSPSYNNPGNQPTQAGISNTEEQQRARQNPPIQGEYYNHPPQTGYYSEQRAAPVNPPSSQKTPNTSETNNYNHNQPITSNTEEQQRSQQIPPYQGGYYNYPPQAGYYSEQRAAPVNPPSPHTSPNTSEPNYYNHYDSRYRESGHGQAAARQDLPAEAMAAALSADSGKKLEKIILFYSDKTFGVYTPE